MEVNLDIFKSNNDDLKASDIIADVSIGKTSNGFTILQFHTVDQYHYVEEESSGYGCIYISVRPILYNSAAIIGKSLCEHDFEGYLNHPDYYFLQLKVHVSDSKTIITPLKHLYHVAFIPNAMVFGNVDFEQVELGDPLWELKKEVR